MISTLITRQSTFVTYPCFMESISSPDLVVLFSGPSTGTAVAVPNGAEMYEVGHHSEAWNDDAFKVFDGELNLCNEPELGDDEEEFTGGVDDGEGHVLGGLAAKAQGQGQSCAGCTGCDDGKDEVDTTKAGVLSARYGSLDEILTAMMRGKQAQGARA